MQFMIYHIYSVQKQHNGKEAFSRGLTTVWINYYAFPALGANCSLLKAQEEDDGEEGQTVLSNCSNIVNFLCLPKYTQFWGCILDALYSNAFA